jgi:hypothetical protein
MRLKHFMKHFKFHFTWNSVISSFKFHEIFQVSFHIEKRLNMHHLKGILNVLIVDYGGMSISVAGGRLRPETRSPVDRATMVFC